MNQRAFVDQPWQNESLADGQFETVTTATTATAGMHLVYNSKTGELSYDADGFGARNDSVVVAILGVTTQPVLVAADFIQG